MAEEIFRITLDFPRDEVYSLTSQIRRSSRSIGAQIAESWAKRRYIKHFISKLTDADGELQETIHWVITAKDNNYIDSKTLNDLRNNLKEIGKMLSSMIYKADKFCNQDSDQVREEPAGYNDEF